MARTTTQGQWLRLRVERRDRHGWVTLLAVAGVVIAAAMAVFGLPPVDLHGPLHRVGIMDPLCGGTRAARFTAQGNLVQAWRYNPLGIITVLGAAAAVLRAVFGGATRRWVNARMSWTPKRRRIAITLAIVLVILLEVRQQTRADLLIAGT